MAGTKKTQDDRGNPLIDEVASWLMSQALEDSQLEETVLGCFDRLYAAGIPLFRCFVAFRTLHPLYRARSIVWRRGAGELEIANFSRAESEGEGFTRSPHYFMLSKNIANMRRHFTGADALLDFDIFEELRDQGASDYLAFLIPFGGGDQRGLLGSWTTDRPDGFTEHEVRDLQRIAKRLGVVCKGMIESQVTRNIVSAYFGGNAGKRILGGSIGRGDAESLTGAIWYADLRNSTALADRLPPEVYLETLDSYFESTAGAVMEEGGEVLLMIGDAVLAVFATDDSRVQGAQACAAAARAAENALKRIAAVNLERGHAGAEPLKFGVGLHYGSFMFGNIGTPERLEFTAVGGAINEAARLEALSKELKLPIVASEAFASQVPESWQDRGLHSLRGVAHELRVFALAGKQAVEA
ncbi:MAG: adenylate/guanylate cyclase domain-containing protein [Rhodovibrionaceae bacterium]